MSTVGVKLDEETRERLRRLGEAKSRSAHWLMKEAIERYLDDEEHYEREKAEDRERWRRYVETGRVVTDLEMQGVFDVLIDRARQGDE